jgi:hypothetical protein
MIGQGKSMSTRSRIYLFLCLTLAIFVGIFCIPPIAQDPQYHLFADNRDIFGIPNFFDVISNCAFLLAGIWGLALLIQGKHAEAFRAKHERWPYIVFFLGFVLTSFGSAYYHLSPENGTLVWDRLAMALVCIGILAGALNDHIGFRAGTLCLGPMLAFGIFSVIYWYVTELQGSGDLRPYIIVQFYTLAALLLLALLFPARYTHSGWLLAGGMAYLAAKGLELLDKELFRLVHNSGHTFKHLVASLAAVCIVRMLAQRRPVEPDSPERSRKSADTLF